MKKIVSSYLLILLSGVADAQIFVSGDINSNTTWTAANSPYIVTGQLTLFNDYTLTIEPGVTVKFNDSVGFECRGSLLAIGTATDSITFTSSSSTPDKGIWQGISVVRLNPAGPPGHVRMEYCKGMYANTFIDLDLAYQGPYVFNHCYFYKNLKVNNDGGIGGTYFNYCRFESNSSALNYVQFGGRVSHSEFISNIDGVSNFANVDTCIFFDNSNIALAPYGSAKGNKVYGNNIGVQCLFNGVNNTFINNLVYDNNIGVEILSYFNGFINFTNNSICNNALFNIKNSGSNDADLSNNWWCSDDSLFIRSKIYDGYINPSVGLVKFSPFLSNGNPLPVQLLDFSCYAVGNTAFLNWITASESDLQKYVIQYSLNGIDFQDVTTINPRGSNSRYSFTYEPIFRQAFYRLKMIESNGNSKYSMIRYIKFEDKKGLVTIAPNPASGVISIVSKKVELIKSIQIISLEGKKLKFVSDYLNGQTINISELPNGVYIIRVTFKDEQVDYSRFIKI